jgi:hypothetical protein
MHSLTWLDLPLPAAYFAAEPAPTFDAVRTDEGPETMPLRIVVAEAVAS